MTQRVSRRRFLLIATAFAGGAAAGCSKHSPRISCTDETGLDAAEKQARVRLKYIDHTPGWATSCTRCRLFYPPKRKGACGGCQVLAGPINPDGYCKAFVAWGPT